MAHPAGVVLALDTSTPVLSMAVAAERLTESVTLDVGNRMGAAITPALTELLAAAGITRADLAAIGVGVGPGPFTSLRVGLMFARALGWGLGIPVVGACGLDVIARGVRDRQSESEGSFGVAVDARRREIYWATYDGAGVRTAGPIVSKASEAPLCQRWFGPGWLKYDLGESRLVDPAGPAAAVLADWVRVEDLAVRQVRAVVEGEAGKSVPQHLVEPRPLYLRRPDAEEQAWR